jgi:hypothetical protein
VIVLGNKRSDLLGMALILAMYGVDYFARRGNWLPSGRPALRKLAVLALAFPLTAFLIIRALSLLSSQGVPLLTIADRFTAAPGRFGSTPGRYGWVTRFTSARDVEFRAVSASLDEAPLGHAIGKGFGASFDMRYLSPYTAELVWFERLSADVIVAHFGLVNGWPAAIGLLALLLWVHVAVAKHSHLYDRFDYAVVLFFCGFLLDLALGLVQTNALYWTALGFVYVRLRSQGAVPARLPHARVA